MENEEIIEFYEGLPAELPRYLWFYSTREAQESLAARFDLPINDGMQDWEFTAPRDEQMDEYLAAYEGGELDENERFALMMILLDRVKSADGEPQFVQVVQLAERDIELNLHTVHYFACVGSTLEDAWEIAPFLRTILRRHRALWEQKEA